MTSVLKVTEIQDPTNSNTALTIDSSGHVIHGKRPYVFLDFGGDETYESMSVGNVEFDNVIEGDTSLWNSTTYKFTCPVDGLYFMSHNLLVASAQAIEVHVYKNSTMMGRFYEDARINQGSVLLSCDANDEIYWYNASGRDFYNGDGNNRYCFGSIGLVG